MRSSKWWIAFALAVGALGALQFEGAAQQAAPEPEQAPAAAPARAKEIALLDVNYVLQNDPAFKDSLVAMKAQVADVEARLESRKSDIQKKAEQLKIMVAGTPEHDRLTREIVTAQAELAGTVQTQKAALQRREAILYLDAYQEIVRESEAYAQEHGIAAVMRLVAPEVDASNPQSILQYINRPIVWHDGQRDISREILERLKNKPKPQPPAVPEPAPPRANGGED